MVGLITRLSLLVKNLTAFKFVEVAKSDNAENEDFAIFPAVSKILAVFRVFTFFGSILNAVSKVEKNTFRQQGLGFGIFPYNFVKVLIVSRKSEAAS